MSDIVVIGSFVMDMVAHVNSFPNTGETMIGKTLMVTPGGKGCNQCVGAARLQVDCEMIGVVGEDAYGKKFLRILDQEHIQHPYVVMKKDVMTGISQIQVDRAGDNKIIVIPGANYAFDDDCLAGVRCAIQDCKLVMLQMELPFEALEKLIQCCEEARKPILLNPAPAVPLDASLIKNIEYLTPNETELSILTNRKVETREEMLEAVDCLHDMGANYVVATLGAAGCLVSDGNEKQFIKGYQVHAVDTVAAGDCFNAALAKGIIEGRSLLESAAYANAAAAIAVTRHGAIASMPYKDEVEQFMKQEVA